MTEYIERDRLYELGYWHGATPTLDNPFPDGVDAVDTKDIDSIPAADVLPRDEAIKMGAELAAMHGSDATSQQLEEAYLKGVEDGMTRREVRPVVLCRDCKHRFMTPNGWHCHYAEWGIEDDDFCSCGEKREES